MRSYGQYCGLAKALDVVGDRWTLLIVRELLILGPSRYTDLLRGLPGIATNLLVDRLREMEEAGLVRREDAPPPIATALFDLTERGKALEPAMRALGSWGGPLLQNAPKGDEMRPHWLYFPVTHYLKDTAPRAAPVQIEVREDDEVVTVEARDGRARVRFGPSPDANLRLSGNPRLVIGLLMGRINLRTARAQGLGVEGDVKALKRFAPVPQ